MTPNVGGVDRTLRLVVGAALLVLLVVGEPPLKWVGLLGIVLVGTALLRWCPLYLPLGINSCGECGTAKKK